MSSVSFVVCYQHIIGMPTPPFIAAVLADLPARGYAIAVPGKEDNYVTVRSHVCSLKFDDLGSMLKYISNLAIRKTDARKLIALGKKFFTQRSRIMKAAAKFQAKLNNRNKPATKPEPAAKKFGGKKAAEEASPEVRVKSRGKKLSDAKAALGIGTTTGRTRASEYDGKKIKVLNRDHGMNGTSGEIMTKVLKCKTVEEAKQVTVGNYKAGTLYIKKALEKELIKLI